MNRLCFASFDPYANVPNVCGMCTSNPPIFRYEFCADDQNARAEYMKGFCCASCATKLLEVLEYAESQEWTREQAALEADGLDVTEFQQRRLAAFGSDRKGLTRSV